jgi:ABC-type antimicrobial peptide transport system permease subunit
MTFAVRTVGDPEAATTAVRSAVNGLDPALPVFDMHTMAERMDRSLAARRAPMLLSLAFGGLALMLSAVGVYGVLACLVVQRTKELGLRLALGCSTSAVFQLVLREGLTLVAAGFLAGAAGVLVLRRSLDSLLFGVAAIDPGVLAAAAVTLALAATAAGALPARRATQISPSVALAD